MKYPSVNPRAKKRAKEKNLHLLEIRLDGRQLPGKTSICVSGACSPRVAKLAQKLIDEWVKDSA